MVKKKVVIVISHPIQYHAPLYKVIQQSVNVDLHVVYLNDKGSRTYFDSFANAYVRYDNDLLSGYSYEFVTEGEAQGIQEKTRRLFQFDLAKRILLAKPDAVYFHGYSSLAFLIAGWKLLDKKVRIFLRGENEDVIKRPFWKNILREFFLKRIFKRIDCFLYIGQENRAFYKKRNVLDDKLYFVPYSADNNYFGIDISNDERLSLRKKICEEYQIDPNGVIFINTCKHRKEKKPMDLVNAFIKANKEMDISNNCTLLMVGDGPLNKEMRMKIQDARLSNVIWTGFVNQTKMRDLLLASDYCVNPGEEPWGCVFNEALPAGLGLISSDRIVGWPDMVKVGQNGFIYRCGCEKSLASILTQCANMPKWINSFRDESRSIAKKYSYETCVTGLKNALDSLD
jgi:glycosyltransferase involved in cell wall biosynthesis